LNITTPSHKVKQGFVLNQTSSRCEK